MKDRVLNSITANLCSFLVSRNNDISGYWGIGILCKIAQSRPEPMVAFSVKNGHAIRIGQYEITGSAAKVHSIYCGNDIATLCTMRFIEHGKLEDGKRAYAAFISAASSFEGKHSLQTDLAYCWAHDPSIESRRA